MSEPLPVTAIEVRLADALSSVLSSRRTALPLAQTLADLSRAEQEFVLNWVDIAARTNAEIGYQLARYAVSALQVMDTDSSRKWIIHVMDVYDRSGLYPACTALRDYSDFAQSLAAQETSVTFQEVAAVMHPFVIGLSGRALRLAIDEQVWTDTQTLYLPKRVISMPTREQNFQLYKAMAAYLWAQLWFGTFRIIQPETPGVVVTCDRFPDSQQALRRFQQLEAVRLNACIERELGGLYREMCGLQSTVGNIEYPTSWQRVIQQLRAPGANVGDTLQLLDMVYGLEGPSREFCYQGQIQADKTESALRQRMAGEKRALRNHLHDLETELGRGRGKRAAGKFSAAVKSSAGRHIDVQLAYDGQPVAAPGEVSELLRSVAQDLGDIPEDHLAAASDAEYRSQGVQVAEDVLDQQYDEQDTYVYSEWDYRRQDYRKDWCLLREIDVQGGNRAFVDDTLQRYTGLVAELRRTFEILRGEDKLLKKQQDGDEIDLDAVVEAVADYHAGREMSDRLLVKLKKHERDVAVVFMVDMSGSTKGWINEAERESLVLLCEALAILGDRYAIYGFSGMTRKRCELYRIKAFSESYDEHVRERIAGIRPQDYTRMGVVIRHLTQLFRQIEARTKLLVTLSDGMPDDYDGYRGRYGIEDTRKALIEAKHEGIHPFCITIDKQARDYLPHMYGAVNYVLVDRVARLPFKVSDIYRQLTT